MAAVTTDQDERHTNDLFGFWLFWNNHQKEKDATQFDINGLGERLAKESQFDDTVYAYDEAGHILGEYDGRGNVLEETVYLGDTPIAVLGGGSPSDWGPHYIRTPHRETGASFARILRRPEFQSVHSDCE